MNDRQRFSQIPTNLVCGFLGAGKTTTIRSLLQHKPAHERWAVVVNEFGQVGIDASLLQSSDAVITDIPGGCMCCVSSQSFTVGLNRLIKSHNPDRILIEPTGLGHPGKLIQTLYGEYFSEVIDLRGVITLVDARQLNDSRYLEHETFIDQLEVADVLVANKLDQYEEVDRHRFYDFLQSFQPAKQAAVMIEQGMLDTGYLDYPHDASRQPLHPHAHSAAHQHSHAYSNADEPGWQLISGSGNGFASLGWRLDACHVFHRQRLLKWLEETLHGLSLDRIKAVMRTEQGWLEINMTATESTLQNCSGAVRDNSLLEMIGRAGALPPELNSQLIELRDTNHST